MFYTVSQGTELQYSNNRTVIFYTLAHGTEVQYSKSRTIIFYISVSRYSSTI